ncbi:MAG: ATP-binding cassette domain-containing protein [Planctomycetota bacterium]
MDRPGLIIENLTKHHRNPRGREVTVLQGFALDLEPSIAAVIHAPSGHGKTTLLRLIAGLETPDQGAITFQGKRLDKLPPAARPIALLPQDAPLWPHLTIKRNVTEAAAPNAPPAAELLDQLEVGAIADRKPHELSGGERRRAALASAIATAAPLLLLDEPTAGLSGSARTAVIRLIADQQATRLITTHDPSLSEELTGAISVGLDPIKIQTKKG